MGRLEGQSLNIHPFWELALDAWPKPGWSWDPPLWIPPIGWKKGRTSRLVFFFNPFKLLFADSEFDSESKLPTIFHSSACLVENRWSYCFQGSTATRSLTAFGQQLGLKVDGKLHRRVDGVGLTVYRVCFRLEGHEHVHIFGKDPHGWSFQSLLDFLTASGKSHKWIVFSMRWLDKGHLTLDGHLSNHCNPNVGARYTTTFQAPIRDGNS